MRKRKIFFIALLILVLITLSMLALCLHVENMFFPPEYRDLVKEYSEEYGLDPLLVAAVIQTESRFDAHAVSKSSARGLMQIMPGTGNDIAERLNFEGYSEDALFIPEVNVRFGCYYLSKMKTQFDDDITLALAAYNSGPENVRKWLEGEGNSADNLVEKYGFTETRNYVRSIRKIHWGLKLCSRLIDI